MPSATHPSRGAVLLLVIAAVAILTVLAVELAARSSVDALQAARASRDAAFRRLFDSAIEAATGVLAEGGGRPYDDWGDTWNREYRFTLGPDEQVAFRIADESGKLRIGSESDARDDAPQAGTRLERLLAYLKAREPGRAESWEDVRSRLFDRLGLAYRDRRIVRAFEPDPLRTLDGLREAGLSLDAVFGETGLCRYLTCFGDGRVNINTAPPAVLFALDEEFDESVVAAIVRRRGGAEGETAEYSAFKDPRELQEIDGVVVRGVAGGQPRVIRDLFEKVRDRVSVSSTCFSVRMNATAGGRSRRAWAFVEALPSAEAGRTGGRTVRRLAFEALEP
jgi:type II secretory pathway component PulK